MTTPAPATCCPVGESFDPLSLHRVNADEHLAFGKGLHYSSARTSAGSRRRSRSASLPGASRG